MEGMTFVQVWSIFTISRTMDQNTTAMSHTSGGKDFFTDPSKAGEKRDTCVRAHCNLNRNIFTEAKKQQLENCSCQAMCDPDTLKFLSGNCPAIGKTVRRADQRIIWPCN